MVDSFWTGLDMVVLLILGSFLLDGVLSFVLRAETLDRLNSYLHSRQYGIIQIVIGAIAVFAGVMILVLGHINVFSLTLLVVNILTFYNGCKKVA